ncbi:MAG: hypothetical protein ACI81T_000724 [Bacteroidia bacterium]|jgi:hypothetical protein
MGKFIKLSIFLAINFLLLGSFQAFGQHITGYAYLDDDGDGILFGSEGGLSGVRVFLYQDNGDGVFTGADALIATQTTDIQGIYDFNVQTALYTTVTYSISNNNDDAEEEDDGDMNRDSGDLEMMEDGDEQRAIGLRFRNVAVPQGTTITEAFITFIAEDDNSGDTDLVIQGHDTNSSGGFSNADFNITVGRTPTTASVAWDDIPEWLEHAEYETPDISSIVEEIVGRGGWDSGNNMSIIITGSGKRVAYSRDGDDDKAAELTIRYDVGAITTGTYFVVLNSSDLIPGGTFTEPNVSGVRTSIIASSSDSLELQNIGYVGEAVTCFLIPESEDRLEVVNRVTGYQEITGPLGSPNGNVEAISLDVNNNVLYAMDEDELGVIDLQAGAFITRGNTVGDGDGSVGNIDFDDVDALSYDFNDDVLYGVQANSGRKLIIIDPLTGELIENAFGAGVDYVEITGTGLLDEISDLTFAPSTGELYGINTESDESQVIQINKLTGVATVIATVEFDGDDLLDVEALAFTIYNTTTLYVTTGNEEDDGTENSFYSVDISTDPAVATKITTGGNALTGDDYESCDCFFKAVPSLLVYDPLPLNLLSFSGKAVDNYNELNWNTANEINFSHFEIYRSTTGRNFNKIGEVNAKGVNSKVQQSYSYEDEPQTAANYYKLKMVGLDGTYKWSKIIMIKSDSETTLISELVLYPNPTKSSLNISIKNAPSLGLASFELYNLNGQLAKKGCLNLATKSESVIDVEDLSKSVYLVRIETSDGERFVRKFHVLH